MDDFKEVQENAQEMTKNVTDATPSHTVDVLQPKKPNINWLDGQVTSTPEENIEETYNAYNLKGEPVTQTTDSTVGIVDEPVEGAIPYTGGAGVPNTKFFGAERGSSDMLSLRQKFLPVEKYPIRFGNMSGMTDSLNMRKAFAQLSLSYQPGGIDFDKWYGYDRVIEVPHEDFIHGFGRGIINAIPQMIIGAAAGVSSLYGSAVSALGDMFSDQDMLDYGNNILHATREVTEKELMPEFTFSYGPQGDNTNQNKSGTIMGSLVGSMGASLLSPMHAAATWAAAEGLGNAYQARMAALDRGVSPAAGLGIWLGAGTGTAALGLSTRAIEPMVSHFMKPAMGWTKMLKTNPKEFAKQALIKNFIVSSYDAMTESAQDMWSQWLGSGELTGEDWEQAFLTLAFGLITGTAMSAVKVKKDKADLQTHINNVGALFTKNKALLDSIVKASNGKFTEEHIKAFRDFLESEESLDGFNDLVREKLIENLDRIENLDDKTKAILANNLKKLNPKVSLSKEMLDFDKRVGTLLSKVKKMSSAEKSMAHQFLRGIALNNLVFNGVLPSQMKLPIFENDKQAYVEGRKVSVGSESQSHKSNIPLSLDNQIIDSGKFVGNKRVSADVRNEAVSKSMNNQNVDTSKTLASGITAHELWHFLEETTGLKNVKAFMERMTKWANTVLPNIAKGKKGVAKSDAIGYAVQYAKSLKPILGLEGDIRKYIEVFNAVSSANAMAEEFAEYNKNLKSIMKDNAELIEDILSGYGEGEFAEDMKEFIRTGNSTKITSDQIKQLYNIMSSLVDSETADKLSKAFGDKQLADSFLDEYERQYEERDVADKQLAKESLNRIRAKIDKAADNNKTSLEKQVEETKKEIIKNATTKNVTEQQPVTEQPKSNEEQPAKEENKPENYQYAGDTQPLMDGDARFIEKWLAGEKLTPTQYEAMNRALEKITNSILVDAGIDIKPKVKDYGYVIVQSGSGSRAGTPTPKAIPLTAEAQKMIDSITNEAQREHLLQILGDRAALANEKRVFSVENDLKEILEPLYNKIEEELENMRYDFEEQENEDEDEDDYDYYDEDRVFEDEIDDAEIILGDIDEAIVEVQKLQDEIGMRSRVSEYEAVHIKEAYKKILDILNRPEAPERIKDVASEYVDSLTESMENIYTDNFESEYEEEANDVLDLDASEVDPWGKREPWKDKEHLSGHIIKFVKSEQGKDIPIYARSIRNPIKDMLSGDIDVNSSKFDFEYWQSRFPSLFNKEPDYSLKELGFLTKLEKQEDGTIVEKPTILAESKVAAREFGEMYARNEDVESAYDWNKLMDIDKRNGLTKSSVIRELLDAAASHKQMGIDKKQDVITIIAAKRIADKIFEEKDRIYKSFNEWATINNDKTLGGINESALNFIRSERGRNKLETAEGYLPLVRTWQDMKRGDKVLIPYQNNMKSATVITSVKTPKENLYYILRVEEAKKTYDLVWDAREFKILDDEGAFRVKPYEHNEENFAEFKRTVLKNVTQGDNQVDNYLNARYMGDLTANIIEGIDEKQVLMDFNPDGQLKLEDRVAMFNRVILGNRKYAIENVADAFLIDDEFSDIAHIGGDVYTKDWRDNIDALAQMETLNLQQMSNEENFAKMLEAEENKKPSFKTWINGDRIEGMGGTRLDLLKKMVSSLKERKIHPFLYNMTRGSGLDQQFNLLYGFNMGLNGMTEKAIKDGEEWMKKRETEYVKYFGGGRKGQTAFGKWLVQSNLDLKDVKAELWDKQRVNISRREIMSLYLAELANKSPADGEFGINRICGGNREDGGNIFVYNQLRKTYRNFDELLRQLTQEDKDIAKLIASHLPALRADSSMYVPVNTYDDYNSNGWVNRRGRTKAVFGSSLLRPDQHLVAVDLYEASTKLAKQAAIRRSNFLSRVGYLSDLHNMSALIKDNNEILRKRFKELDEVDQKLLQEAVDLSRELDSLIMEKAGVSARNHLLNSLKKGSSSSEFEDSYTEKGPLAKLFQKLTRTAQAKVLAFKPKQALTNFFGNYSVMGGLSNRSSLWFNTYGLLYGLSHARDAWNSAKNSPVWVRRLEQSAIAEQYRRVADMKSDSILQDIEGAAYKSGMGRTGNVIAVLDNIGKSMTKAGITYTNALPDVFGIAIARYVVYDDVYARVKDRMTRQYAEQKKGKPTEAKIAEATENEIADYIFGHISSSNYMARGQFSKTLARNGLEALMSFTNDTLQKAASLGRAIEDLYNTDDPEKRKMLWKEINGILLSSASYVVIQAGLIGAGIKLLSGEELDDKEKEFLQAALIRETLGQITSSFYGNFLTQPMVEALVFGKQGGFDTIPFNDIMKVAQKTNKGDIFGAGLTGLSLLGFTPLERAGELYKALRLAFGEDETGRGVALRMLYGRTENTAMNQMGLRKDKNGEYKKKKSLKKDEK